MNLKTAEDCLNLSERMIFLKKFIEAPSQVGSLTPSSRFLANKMLECIDWNTVRALAELGAGTGIFTKYIYRLKHPDCKVAVFEKDKVMRSEIAARYSKLSYFEDVLYLTQNVKSIGIKSLDVVVSGLPFALIEESVRENIIEQVIKILKPKGIFVAFQYSLQMKPLLLKKYSQVDISFVPFNFPPAFVYVCHK
ncbi:MAG: methyltransferase domain-containing protein [Syntrophomonadaceae bacterium]|nr:methyltransferase domain-containing protein [Syntrophomonadaceae bacterium]MDD3023378.1 methyltransferase domain-containing protein [Syntrophomonadaceae bacterium]